MNPDDPGSNPYDFITNNGAQQKPKFSVSNLGDTGSNKGFIVRIGLIVGAGTVLIIIVVVVMSLVGGNKNDEASLIKLAQTQKAIVLTSDDGTHHIRSQTKANSAMTTNLAVQTQLSNYLAYLETQGITIKTKQLVQGQSADTTAQLKQAVESSTYDSVYAQVIQKQLTSYASDVQTLYQKVTGPKLRTILSNEYDQVQLLVKQLGAQDTVEDTTPQS